MPGEPNGSFQAFPSFAFVLGLFQVGDVSADAASWTGLDAGGRMLAGWGIIMRRSQGRPKWQRNHSSHLFTVLYGLRGVLWRLRAAKALAESANMFALMESEGAATFIGRHGLQDHCTCYENELFCAEVLEGNAGSLVLRLPCTSGNSGWANHCENPGRWRTTGCSFHKKCSEPLWNGTQPDQKKARSMFRDC